MRRRLLVLSLVLSVALSVSSCSDDERDVEVRLSGDCAGFTPAGELSRDEELAQQALDAWLEEETTPVKSVCVLYAAKDADSPERTLAVITDGYRVARFFQSSDGDGGRMGNVDRMAFKPVSILLDGEDFLVADRVARVWAYSGGEQNVLSRTEVPLGKDRVVNLREPVPGLADDDSRDVVLVADTIDESFGRELTRNSAIDRKNLESVLEPGRTVGGGPLLGAFVRSAGNERRDVTKLTLVGMTSSPLGVILVGAVEGNQRTVIQATVAGGQSHRIGVREGTIWGSPWALAAWVRGSGDRNPVLVAAMVPHQGAAKGARAEVYVGKRSYQVSDPVSIVPVDLTGARVLPDAVIVGFSGNGWVLPQAVPEEIR